MTQRARQPWTDDSIPTVVEPFDIYPLDTAHGDPRYILELGESRRLVVTRKMRDLLLQIDGRSTLHEIGLRLSALWRVPVSPSLISNLLRDVLGPIGVVATSAGRARRGLGARPRRRGPLESAFAIALVPGPLVSRLATPLSHLFAAPVVLGAALLIVGTHVALYGLMDQAARANPQSSTGALYFESFALGLLTLFVHELGHAAAVRRFGGRPGDIGFTLYFVFPALYNDTRSAWRFTRAQRVIVDAGGAYFQLLAVSLLFALYVKTGRASLLPACTIADSVLLVSVNPFFKFDGYWALSDALGIPNLHNASFQALSDAVRRCTRWRDVGRGRVHTTPPHQRAVLAFGAFTALFVAFVFYFTVTSGPAWLAAYPQRAAGLFGDVVRGRGIQSGGRLSAALQLFFETTSAFGLVLFWHRAAALGIRVVLQRHRARRAGTGPTCPSGGRHPA